MSRYVIETGRLGLRNWTDVDLEPFQKMNLDLEVMRYFPSVLTAKDSLELMRRMQRSFADYGFCYFAADVLATGEFIGMIGILNQTFKSEFTPSVDIGWRLKRSSWGKGYATEGASACLDYGFSQIGLSTIYSYAPTQNKDSEAVMKKIGMEHIGYFEHPKLKDHPELQNCVVYQKHNN